MAAAINPEKEALFIKHAGYITFITRRALVAADLHHDAPPRLNSDDPNLSVDVTPDSRLSLAQAVADTVAKAVDSSREFLHNSVLP